MGGTGSGRPGWHDRVEHALWLDINRLHRLGCLAPGFVGGWNWTRAGERTGDIGLASEGDALRLTYRVRDGRGDWQAVEQRIPLARVPCNFGGTRPYFVCPGWASRRCLHRVARLYCIEGRFRCRGCGTLTYASQTEAVPDRLMRRANKRRVRLGGEPGAGDLPPRKPKGMHHRTYERLIDDIARAEESAELQMMVRAARLLNPEELRALFGRDLPDLAPLPLASPRRTTG